MTAEEPVTLSQQQGEDGCHAAGRPAGQTGNGALGAPGGTRRRQVYADDNIVGRARWAPVLDEEAWRSVAAKLTGPRGCANHAGPPPVAQLGDLPVPVRNQDAGSTSPAITPPALSTRLERELSLPQQREIVRLLCDVTLFPGRRRQPFDPELETRIA
jgi:hypothetical protein